LREISRSFDAGTYDAVVYGGGIRGTMLAARLALQGDKTLLVERGGGCMGEIAWSRWTRLDLDFAHTGEAGEPAGLYTEWLTQAGGYRDGRVEPCLATIVADRLLRQLGVDVLFEAGFLAVGDVPHVHELALRGQKGWVQAQAFYQTMSETRCDSEIWALTLMNAKLPEFDDQTLETAGGPIPARFERGFYEDETLAYILMTGTAAQPAGQMQSFYAELGEILLALRSSDPALAAARLAHIGDKPLLWSSGHESTHDLWNSVKRRLESRFVLSDADLKRFNKATV